MKGVIPPTVGRVVWIRKRTEAISEDQPEVAFITWVHNDRLINVAGFDADGNAFKATSVPLVQDDEHWPAHMHAEWMPYQRGQAAKTEALEKQLGGK